MKFESRIGECPKCGFSVFPNKPFGMWDGKKDGKKVGGPVLKAACGQCGTALIAFAEILEDRVEWKEEQKTVPKIPN